MLALLPPEQPTAALQPAHRWSLWTATLPRLAAGWPRPGHGSGPSIMPAGPAGSGGVDDLERPARSLDFGELGPPRSEESASPMLGAPSNSLQDDAVLALALKTARSEGGLACGDVREEVEWINVYVLQD